MDTSPTLSIGGSRARAALLTTSGTGTGSTDRRVVFLASQPAVGTGHETKTWPHHWSPHAVRVSVLFILPHSLQKSPREISFFSLLFRFLERFRVASSRLYRSLHHENRFNEKHQVNQRARGGREKRQPRLAGRLISLDIHRKNNRVSMAINLKMFKRLFRG